MNQSVPMPSPLAELAAVTDFLLTDELAHYLRCKAQTIRKAYSSTGNYLGIRPVKPGSRLLWPLTEVTRMLAGGAR
jgi:hypothetical protein